MCELTMIRKLGLGDKFPRTLFHVEKISLVVRLIASNMEIHACNKIVGSK